MGRSRSRSRSRSRGRRDYRRSRSRDRFGRDLLNNNREEVEEVAPPPVEQQRGGGYRDRGSDRRDSRDRNRRRDSRNRDYNDNGDRGRSRERGSKSDPLTLTHYAHYDDNWRVNSDNGVAPLSTSFYGPNTKSLPPKCSGESTREWRDRLRREMVMKVNVWARSPSPPGSRREEKAPVISSGAKDAEGAPSSSRDDGSRRKNKKSSKSKGSRSSSSSSNSSSGSSSSRNKKKKKKKKSKKAKKMKKSSRRDRDGDAPVLRGLSALGAINQSTLSAAAQLVMDEEAQRFQREVQGGSSHHYSIASSKKGGEESSEDEIGPRPVATEGASLLNSKEHVDYGGALLPGEGVALAQFVQNNLRIPRRGEIGWAGEEIEGLESQGFVMSGSRHAVMNAVRIRKENQVYSAEEKRALAMLTFEEKQQKEQKVIAEFSDMLRARQREKDREREIATE